MQPSQTPHKPFNRNDLRQRAEFIIARDGIDAVVPYMRSLKKIYLASALFRKTKLNQGFSKNVAYRHSYLEAAYSARYLARTLCQLKVSPEENREPVV